ncbi:FHA domain-containing protein [Thiohalocapsa marina]|uniref:FHA domain-containing protein n=1 Tax=Thiohalocapsa marina TaxID=424902 RepID=UPI0036DB4D19
MRAAGVRARSRRTRALLTLILLSGLSAAVAQAAAPTSLRIVQALAEGTDLTAYVAVRDAQDRPVSGDGIGALHATLGAQVAEVVATTPFAQTGEGVLYVFLVDISASLDAAQFGRVKTALRDWVAALGAKDQAAILTFGTRVQTRVPPTADRIRLGSTLDALTATDPRTALHEALAQGLALGRQHGEGLPTRRALVILSDGLDDAPGGMTVEEVEAHLAENPVPIYAIGFSRVRDSAQRERGLATLGRLARRSGGLFVDAGAEDPGSAYAAMRETIRAVDRVQLRCPTCTADGNRYRLQIALDAGGLTLTDGVDVRLYPVVAESAPHAEASTPSDPETAPESAHPPESTEPGGSVHDSPPVAPTPSVAQGSGSEGGEALAADGLLQSLRSSVAWWIGALAAGVLAILLGLLVRQRRRRSEAQVDDSIPDDSVDPTGALAPEPSIPEQAIPAQPLPGPPHPPRVEGPSLALTFKSGARRGQMVRLVLAPSALIGRGGGCALALRDDDEVSAQHARLTAQAGRILLADIGSTNGTLLNGVPLSAPTPLRDGDVVRVGQTELHVGGIGTW